MRKKVVCILMAVCMLVLLAGCAAAPPVEIKPLPLNEDEQGIVGLFSDAGPSAVMRYQCKKPKDVVKMDFWLEFYEYGQRQQDVLSHTMIWDEQTEADYQCTVVLNNMKTPAWRFHVQEEKTGVVSSSASQELPRTVGSSAFVQLEDTVKVPPNEDYVIGAFYFSSPNQNGMKAGGDEFDLGLLRNDISLLSDQEYAVVLKCRFSTGG